MEKLNNNFNIILSLLFMVHFNENPKKKNIEKVQASTLIKRRVGVCGPTSLDPHA